MAEGVAALFPERTAVPEAKELTRYLRLAMEVQKRGMEMGKRPFGAILVGPDGEVLHSHISLGVADHAESAIARLGCILPRRGRGTDMIATQYPLPFLWRCTLYTTWEPCAMCAATIYWANIGRVVFAASNARLDQLVGQNAENLTMEWTCQDIFKGGKKDVQVIGPFGSVAEEVVELSEQYWRSQH